MVLTKIVGTCETGSSPSFEAAYSAIVGLILFVFFAWAFARIHELPLRIGFGVLSLWSI